MFTDFLNTFTGVKHQETSERLLQIAACCRFGETGVRFLGDHFLLLTRDEAAAGSL